MCALGYIQILIAVTLCLSVFSLCIVVFHVEMPVSNPPQPLTVSVTVQSCKFGTPV